MDATLLERELKRGSTEVLILALLEERQRHGYDMAPVTTTRHRSAGR
jgi:DNA-binding PadR family transcriptional regulator